jgi:hypothetical protein
MGLGCGERGAREVNRVGQEESKKKEQNKK